ncbi:M13-type metalloendopeptidase [Pseudoalteromonas sp. DL2-H2.2]|uniref:M13-type metalloendopeptidase n=1 Tax=Pseudoalteromonas sp. DL2-H2.2 TaxID=2908889 RepID=UPI002E216487
MWAHDLTSAICETVFRSCFALHGRPSNAFFIGLAQNWRTKKHEAAFRANGPLSNFTPFYEAFVVKEGDKLYRPPSA